MKMIVGLSLLTILLRDFILGEFPNPLTLKERTSIMGPWSGPDLL